jgi:hypothetical protein
MTFVKRVFHRGAKEAIQPMRGAATEATKAAQRGMRAHMEADVAADRERRGATDIRPGPGMPQETPEQP